MNSAVAALSGCLFLVIGSVANGQSPPPPAARAIDLQSSDGTVLKASYYAAGTPGPGVLLLHQSNRTRKEWDDVAEQLAAAGINALSIDMRGFGESGGTACPNSLHVSASCARVPDDLDTALQYLESQSGVERNVIGLGGAGLIGVDNSVLTARRHSAQVKSLVLLSGETFKDGLEFLGQAAQLPELFVVADSDEYPPTAEAMELAYITASTPTKKLVHYAALEDAPWKWYEPNDIGRVPATGNHGTDLFKTHPELPGIIVDWFVTTLIKAPGHAPVDTLASASILKRIRTRGGVALATQQLMKARRRDSSTQLWPEITLSIIAQDYQRAGEIKLAIETFRLNLLAYQQSADANDSLADVYLVDGRKELAKRYAEKALLILDTPGLPASSWTNSETYRSEIRRDAQLLLKKLGEATP